MTIMEVADAAQVSESTVRRWIRAGDLPAYRLGRQLRIRPEEFETFLKAQRLMPAQDQADTETIRSTRQGT